MPSKPFLYASGRDRVTALIQLGLSETTRFRSTPTDGPVCRLGLVRSSLRRRRKNPGYLGNELPGLLSRERAGGLPLKWRSEPVLEASGSAAGSVRGEPAAADG